MKSIGIVLVDWNGLEVTLPCLEALSMLHHDPAFTVKIVVVDNGSDTPIENSIKERFPNVIVIRSDENLGFAGGNNIGIRYLIDKRFDYTLLLNNDTLVDPDFLSPLFQHLTSNDRIAAVQPKIHFVHEPHRIWNAGTHFNKLLGTTGTRGYGQTDKGQFEQPEKMSWLTGCCMLIDNRVFLNKAIGMLSEGYQTYYEDADWSMRVRKQGYELHYVPASRIRHIAGYSVNRSSLTQEGPKNPFVVYLHTRNRIWFMRSYTPFYFKPISYPYQLLYIIGLSAYYFLKGRRVKLSMVGKAFQEGFFQRPPNA